jgi:cytochrome c553
LAKNLIEGVSDQKQKEVMCMKFVRISVLCMVAISLIFSAALGMKHLPEERGKALFNDPGFAGGSKACNMCHPGGRGLEKAADKKEFSIMGGSQKSLEEVVNVCIVNANKGKAIDADSDEMKDIVAYIKSLKPSEPIKAPGY